MFGRGRELKDQGGRRPTSDTMPNEASSVEISGKSTSTATATSATPWGRRGRHRQVRPDASVALAQHQASAALRREINRYIAAATATNAQSIQAAVAPSGQLLN